MVNPDCALAHISPLAHYYVNSRRRRVFLSYADLREYIVWKGLEILKKSSRFNPEYYMDCCREKLGDIPLGFDPYSYYLEHGAAEMVSPSTGFNTSKYIESFPAIRLYGICPAVHYELIGKYI